MTSRWKYLVVTSSTILVVFLLAGARQGASANSNEDQYRHLAVFTEVLSRIKSDYVEEPDLKNVTLGALNGLLESIDPYASHLSADQYKQYLKSKEQKKADVGLVLSKRLGYVGVVDAIPGSPAHKIGLNTGDIIESINGVATRDMPLVYAEMILQGEPGTNVEIGVLRVSKPDPTKLTITRAHTPAPAVTAKMLPDQIALIQVPSLDAAKVKDVKSKLEDLQKQGAKKVILDLRNDPLGSPEDGIKLANLFLDKGLITYLQGQKVSRENFNASREDSVSKLPLTVITNRGTARGAEIAAAALLDNKRAEVVGERTYGDAALRKPITMDDGSAVILSVAKYYSPSGKAIQDTGVTPTVPVADAQPVLDSDDDPAPAPEPPSDKKEDLLLKRAIEVANGVKATAGRTEDNRGGVALTPLGVPARK
ncbi:MAG TPA: S41 family peptidase [Thermoanaerobaculia bacterium]|nr:S41 family peptidase [Thermoanaerobaculia bacterium]